MTDVSYSGPMFDGRAREDFRQAIEEIKDQVAQEGENLVHVRLGSVLKHPTGRYEGSIAIDRQADDRVIVGDNVIYGAWLEGIGSRNAPVTRFRGYSTFRLVTQDLNDHVALEIAQRVIDKATEEANA